jgi:phosphate transport system protein
MNTPKQHIFRRFDKDLEKLRGQVERMGNEVSRQMHLLLGHLQEEDKPDYDDVIENDMSINNIENKANRTVIKLLAKRSPMGRDLRIIIGFSRMIGDLERVGDELVSMAKTLADSSELPDCISGEKTITLAEMLVMAMNLLDRALLAAHNEDVETAREMLEKSLTHQSSYKQKLTEMIDCIKRSEKQAHSGFHAALQSHSLQRICDHICNICEHTVFMVTGEDVNHQDEDKE